MQNAYSDITSARYGGGYLGEVDHIQGAYGHLGTGHYILESKDIRVSGSVFRDPADISVGEPYPEGCGRGNRGNTINILVVNYMQDVVK